MKHYNTITNQSMLVKLTPFKVAIYGIFLYAIIILIAPVHPKFDYNIDALIYIFFNYLFFLLGTLMMVKQLVPIKKITSISRKNIISIFNAALILSSAGILLKMFDRFFIRNLAFTNLIFENRDLAIEGSNNPAAILGSMLFLISFYPLYLIYQFKETLTNRIFIVLSYLMFFYLSVDSLLLAGRFGIIINIFIFLIYLVYFKKIAVNVKTIFKLAAIGIFLMLIISVLWHKRLDEMHMDIIWSMYNSGYSYTMPPKESYVTLLENNQNSPIHHLLFIYIHLCQYYLHGLFEFSELYSFASQNNQYLYGANLFSVVYKFIYRLVGINFDFSEITSKYHIPGLYTSFFGPVLVDFGWFGIIFMFFYGIFQKIVWQLAFNGHYLYLPLYFYLLMTTLFMPVVNLFIGTGNYAIISMLIFIVFTVFTKIKFRKTSS